MRPSAIQKLGLTYDQLRPWNERLVCVALTGYGLDGPFSDRPAYDYVIQALVGVMAITGDPEGPPTKAGYSAVDNSAGIMGVVGVLAKIIEGKLNSWYSEIVLLEQESAQHKKKIEELRKEVGKEAGAGIAITGFVRYELGEGIEKKEDDLRAGVAELLDN